MCGVGSEIMTEADVGRVRRVQAVAAQAGALQRGGAGPLFRQCDAVAQASAPGQNYAEH